MLHSGFIQLSFDLNEKKMEKKIRWEAKIEFDSTTFVRLQSQQSVKCIDGMMVDINCDYAMGYIRISSITNLNPFTSITYPKIDPKKLALNLNRYREGLNILCSFQENRPQTFHPRNIKQTFNQLLIFINIPASILSFQLLAISFIVVIAISSSEAGYVAIVFFLAKWNINQRILRIRRNFWFNFFSLFFPFVDITKRKLLSM